MVVAYTLCVWSYKYTPIRQRAHRLPRLEVINPTCVVVVAAPKKQADLFVSAEALTSRRIKLVQIPASADRRVSAHAQDGDVRFVGRSLGDEVD